MTKDAFHVSIHKKSDHRNIASASEQLGLVDSGLTTSMWEAPGLVRAEPSAAR
jgi:hypothetical protein